MENEHHQQHNVEEAGLLTIQSVLETGLACRPANPIDASDYALFPTSGLALS